MNISTYEARIKALEDQLNPPGPGGSTGLLSVTVSPDITLSDGTSLNAKIAEHMPILDTGEFPLNFNTQNALEDGVAYSVTATPGSTWQASIYNGDEGSSGTIGQPVTITIAVSHRALEFSAYASADLDDDEEPHIEARIIALHEGE